MAFLIDLIRHGEPQGGARYRGQLDDPLSDLGWQQMRSATDNIQPWQQIVSSTLTRCAAFAKELADTHMVPLQCDPAFMEIGFGDWEGKTASELEQQDKAGFYAFYDDPINNTPANAESLLAFQRRIQKAWQTLQQTHADKHILLVAHAGVIRVILAEILAMPLEAMFRIQVPYAAISRVVIYNEGPRLYPQLQFHAGTL